MNFFIYLKLYFIVFKFDDDISVIKKYIMYRN